MAQIRMTLPREHSREAKNEAALGNNGIYQLKIALTGSNPPIWRRVLVEGETTLVMLHHVIQRTMGWWGEHMHEFIINRERYGRVTAASGVFGPEIRDENKYLLKNVAPVKGKSFEYVYDFGDDWNHKLIVEDIVAADGRRSYPVCLGGENACPPEDCGGIHGYYSYLEILNDPSHPEYDDIKDWMPDRFDPQRFSPEGANRSLQKLRKG